MTYFDGECDCEGEMSGRPIVCNHCGLANWVGYLTKLYPTRCERCRRDLKSTPVVEDYETVCINGRYVRRKRRA